jgi:hypothetical protein
MRSLKTCQATSRTQFSRVLALESTASLITTHKLTTNKTFKLFWNRKPALMSLWELKNRRQTRRTQKCRCDLWKLYLKWFSRLQCFLGIYVKLRSLWGMRLKLRGPVIRRISWSRRRLCRGGWRNSIWGKSIVWMLVWLNFWRVILISKGKTKMSHSSILGCARWN